MPDASRFDFPMKELAEILVREAGITEGKWTIGVNFGIHTANFGQTENHVYPTLMAAVESVNIVRHPENVPITQLTVDASKIGKST